MAHLPNGAWIPDSAARTYSAVNAEYRAEIEQMVETLDDWNRVLKAIDPELQLVKAKENAHTPGLTPGYYHVLRRNPIGPPTIIPVETEDGGFKEPDSGLLEKLRRSDLWNDRASREREEAFREVERQRQRRIANEREERQEEIAERWKSVSSPGVSMSKAGKWRYRAKAPRA